MTIVPGPSSSPDGSSLVLVLTFPPLGVSCLVLQVGNTGMTARELQVGSSADPRVGSTVSGVPPGAFEALDGLVCLILLLWEPRLLS